MEKMGVIREGLTPPEKQGESGKIEEKVAAVENLDSDFRKKAAEAAAKAPSK